MPLEKRMPAFIQQPKAMHALCMVVQGSNGEYIDHNVTSMAVAGRLRGAAADQPLL